jgi:hypothetical protein
MNLCETLKRVFASNPEPRGGKPKENNRIDTKTPPTAPEVHETLRDAMVAVGKDPLPVAHTPRKRDLAAIWPFSAPGVALMVVGPGVRGCGGQRDVAREEPRGRLPGPEAIFLLE